MFIMHNIRDKKSITVMFPDLCKLGGLWGAHTVMDTTYKRPCMKIFYSCSFLAIRDSLTKRFEDILIPRTLLVVLNHP